ncbi:hypothetical protein BC567DRAFT_231297 [Phyllosticta citribraziliensis]
MRLGRAAGPLYLRRIHARCWRKAETLQANGRCVWRVFVEARIIYQPDASARVRTSL